ncbi:MAG: EAL domain-containing response regulator [Rhodospirillaceae bacterium]|nr:EAL domain-containing response regulator [Rhodospirillaceae bacterium]
MMTHRNPQDIRVLVVDDKEFIRNMMKRILEGLGLTHVALAGSGQQAMDLLTGGVRSFDAVFCDLMMPDMDGVELVRHAAVLKSPPAFAFVSGTHTALLATTEDMARARGLTVLGTVRKPVSRDSIKQILDQIGMMPDASPKRAVAMPVPTKADIARAIDHGQFQLYYQPKQNLRTGKIDGFESLIRWLHPDYGLVAPGLFIGEAERSGLIGPLTDWVVMAALDQCSSWNGSGLRTKLSINLSAHMLVDLDLPDRMSAEALRSGIDPKQIILEVTESGVFADTANTLDILARLHMKGFDLSIDDFGTGYSSMEQLRRVPFSEMKIDRAFVHRLPDNPRARAILESSATLARNLGMSVVAEGAETDDEVTVLKQAGIDIVQGYVVARPMPADQVRDWLRARK